jgi:hypothetical protein
MKTLQKENVFELINKLIQIGDKYQILFSVSLSFFLSFFLVLGFKTSALHLLGKCSTT